MMRILLVLAVSGFLLSCNDNRAADKVAPPAKPAPQYYFFPKANVYFDSANREYLFQAADGRSWITEKQIPAVMHQMMDKSVYIDTPAQPVWKDNENHRLVYSAVLYASPADTVEKKEPRPVPKQATVDSSNEKKKEKKSGIRRFFEKLFGGKKKDDNKAS